MVEARVAGAASVAEFVSHRWRRRAGCVTGVSSLSASHSYIRPLSMPFRDGMEIPAHLA